MPNNRYSREKRNEVRAANYAQTRVNATRGREPWTRTEDRAIIEHAFEGETDLTDRQLSERIGRSVQSIQIRRSRIRP